MSGLTRKVRRKKHDLSMFEGTQFADAPKDAKRFLIAIIKHQMMHSDPIRDAWGRQVTLDQMIRSTIELMEGGFVFIEAFTDEEGEERYAIRPAILQMPLNS